MLRFFNGIYSIWSAFWFVVAMIVTMPFVMIPLIISPRLGGVSFFFIRVWVWIFSIFSFVFFKAHNREIIDRKKSYIYTITHTSFLDAPAIPMSMPGQLRGLGKKELAKIPIFGFIASRFAIWVDRSDQESRKKSIEKMKNVLSNGISMMVAPEGTRNDTDEPLLPFFNGPFRLAIETQIPILPTIIYRANRLLPKNNRSLKPGTVHTYFLPEVSVNGLTEDDLPELKEKVFQMMKQKIEELDKLG